MDCHNGRYEHAKQSTTPRPHRRGHGREPEKLTAVEPTDEAGWIVEAEMVERRIRVTDILALYEIELGADGGVARMFEDSSLCPWPSPITYAGWGGNRGREQRRAG